MFINVRSLYLNINIVIKFSNFWAPRCIRGFFPFKSLFSSQEISKWTKKILFKFFPGGWPTKFCGWLIRNKERLPPHTLSQVNGKFGLKLRQWVAQNSTLVNMRMKCKIMYHHLFLLLFHYIFQMEECALEQKQFED